MRPAAVGFSAIAGLSPYRVAIVVWVGKVAAGVATKYPSQSECCPPIGWLQAYVVEMTTTGPSTRAKSIFQSWSLIE